MNIKDPVEVVFDTSVIIGAILEDLGKEEGSSRDALNSIIKRHNHILRISKDINDECINHFHFDGLYSNMILKILLGPLESENKIRRISYISEDINLKVSVPEHDRHVAEAAVAVKNLSLEKNALPKKKRKRKGITVCLVTKNLRHFEPEEMRRNHDISVLTPEEYVDP